MHNKLAIFWSLFTLKMHVIRYNFFPVNMARNNFSTADMARTSKKVGQACFNLSHYLLVLASKLVTSFVAILM